MATCLKIVSLNIVFEERTLSQRYSTSTASSSALQTVFSWAVRLDALTSDALTSGALTSGVLTPGALARVLPPDDVESIDERERVLTMVVVQ